eukprot:1315148-Pyramimonas_sp.AAC.1
MLRPIRARRTPLGVDSVARDGFVAAGYGMVRSAARQLRPAPSYHCDMDRRIAPRITFAECSSEQMA